MRQGTYYFYKNFYDLKKAPSWRPVAKVKKSPHAASISGMQAQHEARVARRNSKVDYATAIPPEKQARNLRQKPSSKDLTSDQKELIIKLKLQGLTKSKIMDEVGVSESRIIYTWKQYLKEQAALAH